MFPTIFYKFMLLSTNGTLGIPTCSCDPNPIRLIMVLKTKPKEMSITSGYCFLTTKSIVLFGLGLIHLVNLSRPSILDLQEEGF